jgi:hypothetical protein
MEGANVHVKRSKRREEENSSGINKIREQK